jgi:hypothetical protein
MARLDGRFETVTQNVAHLTGHRDELEHVLSRVHQLVLHPAHDSPAQLRDRLLAELLDRRKTNTSPVTAAPPTTDTT